MSFNVINSIMFLFGWLWCVLLGTQKATFFPILFSLISLALQLAHVKRVSVAAYCLDVAIASYAALFGFFMEMFFLTLKVIKYTTSNALFAYFPPGWVLMLYPLFALTLNHALSIFNKRPLIALPLFTIGAAISYKLESRLGAVKLSMEWDHPYMFLAFCWFIFLIVLYALNKKSAVTILTLFDKQALSHPITLLYDGDCPLCTREIAHLKNKMRKQETASVVFVNIQDPEYTKEAHHGVDKDEAMKVMHVIDARGAILKGPDAFRELYMRCGYPLLALLYTLPIFHFMSSSLYAFFAKHRLTITGRKK